MSTQRRRLQRGRPKSTSVNHHENISLTYCSAFLSKRWLGSESAADLVLNCVPGREAYGLSRSALRPTKLLVASRHTCGVWVTLRILFGTSVFTLLVGRTVSSAALNSVSGASGSQAGSGAVEDYFTRTLSGTPGTAQTKPSQRLSASLRVIPDLGGSSAGGLLFIILAVYLGPNHRKRCRWTFIDRVASPGKSD